MTTQFVFNHRILIAGSVIAMSAVISGCAPIVVGGAAAVTTAAITTDPRAASEQLLDTEIDLKASHGLQAQFNEVARINASSYNGVVLLTGEASDEEIKQKAVQLVSNIPNVKSVIDRITIGSRAPFSQVTSDTWLASKVRTTLIATKGVPSNAVKTTVEADNVYLQGMVTQKQASDISKTVSSISGVKEVFTLFDIRSPEHFEQQGVNSDNSTSHSTDHPSSTGTTSSMSNPVGAEPSVAPVMAPSSPHATPI